MVLSQHDDIVDAARQTVAMPPTPSTSRST
jgi:hypothetical protein